MTTTDYTTTSNDDLKQDILFDIYIYEKELEQPNLRKEDIESITDKIKYAEELFKTIK